jgi:5-hydroxyisourate hydrolase-like protein (transthyretin family)
MKALAGPPVNRAPLGSGDFTMDRRTARLPVLAMLVTSLVVAATPPSDAHVEIADFVVLPQTGDGDVVRLPGTDVLAVAGGDDSPVVLVDLTTRTVRAIADSVGVRTLDLDEDAAHLYGVSLTPDEVVEIDIASEAVTRRWSVPSSAEFCQLGDVVARGGQLWLGDVCGSHLLHRLDPETGDLTLAHAGLAATSVVGIPGSSRFYTYAPTGDPVLSALDVSGGGLVVRAQQLYGRPEAYSSLRLSDDGSMLFVSDDSFPFHGATTVAWDVTSVWDTGNFPYQEQWPATLGATWSDGLHVGGKVRNQPVGALFQRSDQAVINTFLPAGAAYVGVSDLRLVDGVAALTGWVQGQKRLYVIADPLASEPALTIDVPWGWTGVNTPTPVQGTLREDGAPVPGQSLELTQVSPTQRDLGTVVTDDQGRWSAQWVPDQVGEAMLEVRLASTHDSVDRTSVEVAADYYRIDGRGPTEVGAGGPVTVTFTATHNGQPMPGVTIDVSRHHLANGGWELEEAKSLVTDAEGVVTTGTTAGAVDRYDFVATSPAPELDGWDVHTSLAVRRTATVLTTEDPPSAPPGDPVALSLRLTTGDGQPLPGQQVQFGVVYDSQFGSPLLLTATTDEDGRATVYDTSDQEGRYDVSFSFPGTVELDDAGYGYRMFERTRIPTSVTATGPETGEMGVGATVSGTVAPAEGPVEVKLTDVYTGQVTATTTDDAGAWTAEVTPTLHGPNRWAVSFPGTWRFAPSQTSYALATPKTVTSVVDLAVTGSIARHPYQLTGRLTGLSGPTLIRYGWDGEDADHSLYTNADGTFWVQNQIPGPAGARVVHVKFAGGFRTLASEAEIAVQVSRASRQLSLSAPTWVDPGQPFVVSGAVDYTSGQPAALTVVDPNGTTLAVPVTFTSSDHFHITLQAPDLPGSSQVEWKITYPQDDTYEAATATLGAVVKEPQTIEFVADRTSYVIGDNVSVLMRVPNSLSPATRVTAIDPEGRLLWAWTGPMSQQGFTYRSTLASAQRLRVSVAADATHHATTAYYVIRPRPRLGTVLRSGVARVDQYVVFGHDGGQVVTTAHPALPCVRHVVQEHEPDGWRTIRDVCAPVSGTRSVSTVAWGRARVGVHYRVKPVFLGNYWYHRSSGGWLYFRFR